jgi:hypothetical protein
MIYFAHRCSVLKLCFIVMFYSFYRKRKVYQIFQWVKLIRHVCGRSVSESELPGQQGTWVHCIHSLQVSMWR